MLLFAQQPQPFAGFRSLPPPGACGRRRGHGGCGHSVVARIKPGEKTITEGSAIVVFGSQNECFYNKVQVSGHWGQWPQRASGGSLQIVLNRHSMRGPAVQMGPKLICNTLSKLEQTWSCPYHPPRSPLPPYWAARIAQDTVQLCKDVLDKQGLQTVKNKRFAIVATVQ